MKNSLISLFSYLLLYITCERWAFADNNSDLENAIGNITLKNILFIANLLVALNHVFDSNQVLKPKAKSLWI